MMASEYKDWLARAAQNIESALGMELATPARTVVTEDYLRSAMLRGLVLSYPAGASYVEREMDVSYSSADCVANHAITGSGRPLQHDVGLAAEPDVPTDSGAAVEVKWLASPSVYGVAQDIWKLALARTTANEGVALRTYLIVGGPMQSVKQTLDGLRNIGMILRWSPAGRGNDWPRPSTLDLSKALAAPVGRAALLNLLSRGRHVRSPPACWTKMRASLRWRWFRRLDQFKESPRTAWRLLVWELDHRGFGQTSFDWDVELETHSIECTEGV